MSESNEREPLLGTAPVKGLLSIFLILTTLACSIVAVFSFVIVLILAPTPEDFKDFFNGRMIGTGGRSGDIRTGTIYGISAIVVAIFCQVIRRLFLKR
jgi:hypothetical protein